MKNKVDHIGLRLINIKCFLHKIFVLVMIRSCLIASFFFCIEITILCAPIIFFFSFFYFKVISVDTLTSSEENIIRGKYVDLVRSKWSCDPEADVALKVGDQ